MVVEIRSYQTRDGQKFESRADALRHELFLIVRPILENDALATKFVTGLSPEASAELQALLAEMSGAEC